MFELTVLYFFFRHFFRLRRLPIFVWVCFCRASSNQPTKPRSFFGPRTPVDNLYAGPIALSYFKLKNLVNPVVVSPDAGGVARAKNFLEGLLQQARPS